MEIKEIEPLLDQEEPLKLDHLYYSNCTQKRNAGLVKVRHCCEPTY